MLKVIIAGGRDFNNFDLLYNRCKHILRNIEVPIEIVSGTANGADKLGERFADIMGYGIKRFPAQWNTYGKSAGYRRNVQMGDYGDMLIAFWDYKSRGTKHMIDIARERGKMVYVIKY